MSQHKASRRRTVISALKHKNAANTMLDVIEGLTSAISTARAKIAADTNTTWDTDYVATAGVTAVDFDSNTVGQHKASLRKILIDKLCHKALGDEMTDILEEAQVTHNLILAQMDADSGTLSADGVYEAFRITDVIDVDSERYGKPGQHKRSFKKTLISALSHTRFGREIADEIAALQSEINSMIDDIQAAN